MKKDQQYYKFCAYGFLRNLKFYEPFFMLYLLDSGYNYLEIGFLYALRTIAQNLMEIPAGVLSDVMGRRRTLMTSLAFYMTAFSLFLVFSKLAFLALAMLFYALGEAFRTGTHKAMIFSYLKIHHWEKEKVAYYGLTRSWSQRGGALNALLAALIVILTNNYRLVFAMALLPYGLNLLLIASYPPFLDGPQKKLHFPEISGALRNMTGDFLITLKTPALWATLTSTSIYSGFFKGLKDFLQPVLKALALTLPFFTTRPETFRSALLVGVIYAFIFYLSSWTARKAGPISQKFASPAAGLHRTLLWGALLGFSSGLFMWLNYPLLAVLCFVGIYLIENLRKPLAIGMVADQGPDKLLASVLSVESQMETLFSTLFIALISTATHFFNLATGLSTAAILLALISVTARHVQNRPIKK